MLNAVLPIVWLFTTPIRAASPASFRVWGAGLDSGVSLPVRYFFLQPVDAEDRPIVDPLTPEPNKAIQVHVSTSEGRQIPVWVQVRWINNGTYIVRFRLYESAPELRVSLSHAGKKIGDSPYILRAPTDVYHEDCDCPNPSLDDWLRLNHCDVVSYTQLERDFVHHPHIDLDRLRSEAPDRFSNRGAHSLVHYALVGNVLHRRTIGEHVGFHIFSDATLLSLARKVQLPDVEFFLNLGDWALEKRPTSPLPIISWSSSNDAYDVIFPTYDLAESSLEMMSRVSLDVISAATSNAVPWTNKTERAFWRGRDSRQERLDLVMLARSDPDIDARLTRMFFFAHDVDKYGELVDPVSFFDFFNYKYQISVDGTVAAYRLPYLLAGGTLVLKQDSPFHEHFYADLKPWKHYVPVRRDLSNLKEMIAWAREHDESARLIAERARDFALTHLLPQPVLCYHVKLIQEYAKRQRSPPQLDKRMTRVAQPDPKSPCTCLPRRGAATEDKMKNEL